MKLICGKIKTDSIKKDSNTLAISKNSCTFAVPFEREAVWANSRVAKWGRL